MFRCSDIAGCGVPPGRTQYSDPLDCTLRSTLHSASLSIEPHVHPHRQGEHGAPGDVFRLRADPPKQTEVQPDVTDPAPTTPVQFARQSKRDLDNMSDLEKVQLMDTILARQYISEESAADQLFGKLPVQDSTEIRKEFHYPTGPNMIAMLDQPMPDVPFAYTAGLINFAYDPGVKGDLQRFWDVITPEFGWRTKYGTEVKCIMILVIIGCGWK